MIDLMEIGHLKDKREIEKFGVNKVLLNGNYLFHYMIITNDIAGLKATWHPIYQYNNDGYNGIMLAAREKKYEILNYFLKKYKKIAYLKNKINFNFMHYLDPQDKNYIDIFKNDLHWGDLFDIENNINITPLDLLFNNGSYENIIYVISHIKLNYGNYKIKPAFFNIFYNNNLNNNQLTKITELLYKKDKQIIDMVDNMGYSFIFGAIIKNNFDIIKFIINIKGRKLDTYSPISGNHIFVVAYKISVNTNDYTIPKYIYTNVMKHHDFNETDSNGDTIAHFILKSRMKHKRGNYELEKAILKNFTLWTKLNKDKVTPFDMIINLDFKKYHKFLKYRPENINYKLEKHWNNYIIN